MAGLVLAGDLYIGEYADNGAFNGFNENPINCTELTVSQETNQITRPSRMRDSFGQALDTVAFPGTAELSFATDEFGSGVMALAMRAIDNGNVTRAEDASDMTATIQYKAGKWVSISDGDYMLLEAALEVTSDNHTLVEGTDYQINLRTGMVKIFANLEDGASAPVAADADITVTYKKSALVSATYEGGTKATTKVKLKLDGKNLVNGMDVIWVADEATIAPSGDFNWLSEEFNSITFEGGLSVRAGQNSAYRLIEVKS